MKFKYLLVVFLRVLSALDGRMILNNEFERMCSGLVVASSDVVFWHLAGGIKVHHKNPQ
jgi:hypothetical protein